MAQRWAVRSFVGRIENELGGLGVGWTNDCPDLPMSLLKLLLAAVCLGFLVPVTAMDAGLKLRRGVGPFSAKPLSDVSTGKSEAKGVRASGFVVRPAGLEELRHDGELLLPFVGRGRGIQMSIGGEWIPPADGEALVLVKSPGEHLPVQSFFAPKAPGKVVVAGPFEAEGCVAVEEGLPVNLAALGETIQLSGMTGPGGPKVYSIDLSTGAAARDELKGQAIGGFFLLIVGLLALRSWRRERAARADHISPSSAGRGFSLPSLHIGLAAKLAVGLVAIGAIAARLGGGAATGARRAARTSVTTTAPAAEELARSAAKGSLAAPSPSTPTRTVGERAKAIGEEALGQAGLVPNVASALKTTGQPDGIFTGTSRTVLWKETYSRWQGDVFDLTSSRVKTRVESRRRGGGTTEETKTDTDLPDRRNGEFIQVELLAPNLLLHPDASPDGPPRIRLSYGLPSESGEFIEPDEVELEASFASGNWTTYRAGEPTTFVLPALERLPANSDYERFYTRWLKRVLNRDPVGYGPGRAEFEIRSVDLPEVAFEFKGDRINVRSESGLDFSFRAEVWL